MEILSMNDPFVESGNCGAKMSLVLSHGRGEHVTKYDCVPHITILHIYIWSEYIIRALPKKIC